jgi:hypothetical protein
MSEKFCRMFVDMSGKQFWGKNINVKLACSGKLYCAPPPKQDDAHDKSFAKRLKFSLSRHLVFLYWQDMS